MPATPSFYEMVGARTKAPINWDDFRTMVMRILTYETLYQWTVRTNLNSQIHSSSWFPTKNLCGFGGFQGTQVITTKDCRFDLTGTGLLIKWVILDLCNLSHIDSRFMPFVFFSKVFSAAINTRPEQQEQRQRCWEGWTSSYGAWGGCGVAVAWPQETLESLPRQIHQQLVRSFTAINTCWRAPLFFDVLVVVFLVVSTQAQCVIFGIGHGPGSRPRYLFTTSIGMRSAHWLVEDGQAVARMNSFKKHTTRNCSTSCLHCRCVCVFLAVPEYVIQLSHVEFF